MWFGVGHDQVGRFKLTISKMAKFNPSSKEGYKDFTRRDEKVLGLILWTVNWIEDSNWRVWHLKDQLKISFSDSIPTGRKVFIAESFGHI